ncbi:uncharacterized protein LOC113501776 isoform X2 [Trichoplusia ni]|uniref:Uncharacterized protein LOC113501776 isoform X2 n=1 Tax=Trichoplusia ni TaxID=7111 RepID=A0A7E5WDR4_TRINI|nr:uncharacterized protein LOC113501776 isoform X2 [Trichoplusia ni]
MQTQIGVGNELQRSYRMQDFASPGHVIMRERSFIRPQSHHNIHHNQFNNVKRRSMILTNAKGKPTLEIYRPPDGVATTAATSAATTTTSAASATTPASTNKLNVHAKEFTMAKPADLHNRPAMGIGYASVGLQHSRSAVLHAQVPPHYRPVMPPHALLNSASSGNVPHAQVGPRVHFKLQPQQAIIPEKKKSPPSSLTNGNGKSIRPQSFTPGLKRSKSLTSADALASGMAALGLAADAGDLGNFPPEIQECIDKALEVLLNVCCGASRPERGVRAHADGRGGAPGVARRGVAAVRAARRAPLHRRRRAREHRDLPRVAAQHRAAVVPRQGQVAGFDGGRGSAAADGVPVVPAGDVLPAAAARHPAAQRQRAARPGAAHAHLQVLRGLHPPARALRQRHGEPVLRADVHRARPGAAAAGRAGAAADGGARRLPQHGGGALHPPHAAAAHRAARVALAAARLRCALLLPLLQVTGPHTHTRAALSG